MRLRIAAAMLALFAGTPAMAAEPAVVGTTESANTTATVIAPDKDAEASRWKRVNEANGLARSGKAQDALPLIDALLAEYAAQYPPGATRWYVARDMPESLAYSIKATTELEGSGQDKAHVLTGVAWADAYFVKGYALVELRRTDEARAALDRAVALAPFAAEYLIERAEVSKLERKWDLAMADFVAAEDVATFSGDQEKPVRAQAMRGQAFVHIEQGDFDAAQKILKACLKLDPDDQRAKDELDYIAKARAARK